MEKDVDLKKPRGGKTKKGSWEGEIVYAFKDVPIECRLDPDVFSDQQAKDAQEMCD